MNASSCTRMAGASMVCFALILAGCGAPASAPTSFVTYKATDQSFKIDHPEGWNVEGGGAQGSNYYRAKFSQGSAMIDISADIKGSLIGDIAKSQNTMGGIDEQEAEDLAAVAQVHEMGKAEIAELFGKYQESAPAKVQTAFGDSRISGFSAASTLGGYLVGYRLTALGSQRRILVITYCSAKDWNTLRPAFEKSLASMGQGG